MIPGVPPGGWGGGWMWVRGGKRVHPTHVHMHAHARTCTHACMTSYGIPGISPNPMGAAICMKLPCLPCMHVRACTCVHVCACAHVWGHPPTTPYPHPPTPHPQEPQEAKKHQN